MKLIEPTTEYNRQIQAYRKEFLDCDDNIGIRKTILANGGEYESTVYEPEVKVNLKRYWIDLKLL